MEINYRAFNFVAIKAAKLAKAEPKKILTYLGIITAVFSAFLDNVTTVLLMVPVTFSITKQLELNPRPFLLMQIMASNIGGTATLISDPPIMICSTVKALTFMALTGGFLLLLLAGTTTEKPSLLGGFFYCRRAPAAARPSRRAARCI